MPNPKLPSQQELATMAAQITELKKLVGDDADPRLLLDTIEGETQTIEALDVLLDNILARQVMADYAKAKAKEWEDRADKLRRDAQYLLEKIGQKSVKRPLGTLSLVAGTPSVLITNENLISLDYQRISIDKAAIAKDLKAGIPVDGATLNNSPPTLRITK